MNFEVANHILVPKHEKLSEEEGKELLQKYNITKLQLPRISRKDPAIKELGLKSGDIIKITRNSETAGKTAFFRLVIDE
jgi:DNA-directed RNA polymerase subunit H (RpoH/RPB5)